MPFVKAVLVGVWLGSGCFGVSTVCSSSIAVFCKLSANYVSEAFYMWHLCSL